VTKLVLDRIEVEEAGPNATRLAEAIHLQLRPRSGPVRVHDIASALDIIEIREEPLNDCEAALITLPERNYGLILLNLNSSPQRRRYSVGHELLHFLNPWHEPTSPEGFHCSRQDMIETDGFGRDRHRRQEAEANEFAIELLAPPARVAPYVDGSADLKQALAMAKNLDISREAAARRYVALHEERLAVAFVKDEHLRYVELGAEFPRLSISKGQPIPFLPRGSGSGALSAFEEIDAVDWLKRTNAASLSAQVFRQRDGYAILLLKAESADAEGNDLEDVYDRFARTAFRS
jgi:hypothetical protein